MIAFLLAPIEAPRTNFRGGTIRAAHDPEVIGIQTRVDDNLCHQGATSDVVSRKPSAVVCPFCHSHHFHGRRGWVLAPCLMGSYFIPARRKPEAKS